MSEEEPALQERKRRDPNDGRSVTWFEPGKSGNPSGRPKGAVSINRHLRELYSASDEKEAKLLVKAMARYAKAGDASIIKQIHDRLDGAVMQKLAIDITPAVLIELADHLRGQGLSQDVLAQVYAGLRFVCLKHGVDLEEQQ